MNTEQINSVIPTEVALELNNDISSIDFSNVHPHVSVPEKTMDELRREDSYDPLPPPVEDYSTSSTGVSSNELSEDAKILQEFQNTLNVYIEKIKNYSGSKSQLQRLLMNLAISPFNKEDLHFGYPDEKELFDLASNINSSKFFLMLSGLESEGKITFTEQTKQEENVNVENV